MQDVQRAMRMKREADRRRDRLPSKRDYDSDPSIRIYNLDQRALTVAMTGRSDGGRRESLWDRKDTAERRESLWDRKDTAERRKESFERKRVVREDTAFRDSRLDANNTSRKRGQRDSDRHVENQEREKKKRKFETHVMKKVNMKEQEDEDFEKVGCGEKSNSGDDSDKKKTSVLSKEERKKQRRKEKLALLYGKSFSTSKTEAGRQEEKKREKKEKKRRAEAEKEKQLAALRTERLQREKDDMRHLTSLVAVETGTDEILH